jgi:mRNA-degrading endonuclease RelE of RelBE toxin-antitoxin system
VAARRKRAEPESPAPAAGPELPPESGDAPLHELTRDQLSVFLYLSLLPEETARLVKEWGLSQPGFRREALGEVQRCDLLADAVRADPASRGAVLDLLRSAFGGLPLRAWRIDPPGADELAALVEGEAGLAMVLWRLLADPGAEVRRAAGAWLEELARRHFGPPEGEAAGAAPAPAGRSAAEEGAEQQVRKLEAQLAAARREAEEERSRAEAARRKEEEARERLQAQLREARAREAQAAGEAARAREAAEAARRDLARAEGALAAARSEDSFAEAQRARAQARELEGKASALESRLERARQREEELARELAAARSGASGEGPERPAPEARAEGEGEGEGDPASWLLPVYTREFYDSLEGWDRRIQRAAFKQAHLLAQDHRHPSLRALPLEGLPGYYRVRVATDVRLLYRRGERQNTVEILSLIDREDLDRYVRQAKTRS